jgi:hypothetical protein
VLAHFIEDGLSPPHAGVKAAEILADTVAAIRPSRIDE